MNDEPVAWIDPKELDMAVSTSVTKQKQFDTDIPLYTHPVDAVNISEQYVDKSENNRHDLGIAEAIGFEKGYKAATAKTLTDEEIDAIVVGGNFRYRDFARAILRKAQEK